MIADGQNNGFANFANWVSNKVDTGVSANGQANFWSGLGNQFTGNLDWQRQVSLNEYNNAFNAQQAQLNRDFQREMSNTAYQRAVADLKKAGLNPALAATSGYSASTPSGSAAASGGTSAFASGKGFSDLARMASMFVTVGVNSAMQAQKMAVANRIYDTQYLRYLNNSR